MNEQISTKPLTRLYYLDNLKVFLTILVAIHHVAGACGGDGYGVWGISDPTVDGLGLMGLNSIFFITQALFMTTFFIIAGNFTAKSWRLLPTHEVKLLFEKRAITGGSKTPARQQSHSSDPEVRIPIPEIKDRKLNPQMSICTREVLELISVLKS
jgi:hypothetical protein